MAFSDLFCMDTFKTVEAARKFYVNAIDCSSVLITCPCCFLCVFGDSFFCSISLLLQSKFSFLCLEWCAIYVIVHEHMQFLSIY